MAVMITDCPHPSCQTKHIGLQIKHLEGSANRTIAHLTCPKCDLPSSAILEGFNTQLPNGWRRPVDLHTVLMSPGDILDMNYKLIAMWPKQVEPAIPQHVPETVAKVLIQAEGNYLIPGHEEAAGMMYRKALENGLKKIDPSLTGMLAARIKKLSDAGKLTADITDWAGSIKSLGNEAAHDEEPITRAELEQLRGLTDMTLRYLFTLPEMVRLLREQSTAVRKGHEEKA